MDAYKTTSKGADGRMGPRHLRFHPSLPYAYLMNEYSSYIDVLKYDSKTGSLQFVENILSCNDGKAGAGGTIRISDDGLTLYSSNRGEENSVSMFSIDQNDGKLLKVSTITNTGKYPRDFNIVKDNIYVASQQSNKLSVFRGISARDPSGVSSIVSDVSFSTKIGNPVCVVIG
eukprot:Pgem_evm1s2071